MSPQTRRLLTNSGKPNWCVDHEIWTQHDREDVRVSACHGVEVDRRSSTGGGPVAEVYFAPLRAMRRGRVRRGPQGLDLVRSVRRARPRDDAKGAVAVARTGGRTIPGCRGGANSDTGAALGSSATPVAGLHRGLHVGRRVMQRDEHQDGADSQADRYGDCECLVSADGVLSRACARRIEPAWRDSLRAKWCDAAIDCRRV